ncbi:MAG: DEAD/DEAH box helicase [Gemmatimonadales bacterium]
MKPLRDHILPPDPEAYRSAVHPRGRVIVIAPTRAACETIELALQTDLDTVLKRQHGDDLREWARTGKRFGIVAGTGTGKTLATRFIAEEILGEPLRVGVVNREREATPETAHCNVVIVTTGIARRWLTDDLIVRRDTVVVDEIHQTSAELELCLALGKRIGVRYIWLSATVDPAFYAGYLDSDEVLETSAYDPALAATVQVLARKPEQFLDDRTVRRFISERRGVAVFLPTRAEVERLGADLGARFPRLNAAFYHGGQPIRVIRPFLEGEVPKPFLLAMTAAGQSALNVPGLDTVVIYDARYGNVVDRGRNVLHRLYLGANEILQMAGRVHGRVAGGAVHILSDRILDFASLRPVAPEFQLAGDAERVALTCAAIGVDASDLELPVPLDREAYRRAVARLSGRGLIADGRLTDYGRQVEALPVDRPWAELLLHAGPDLLPVVAGASSIDSLHRMTREERNLDGVVVPGSDHLTTYNLLAEAVNRFGRVSNVHGLPRHVFDETELAGWADARGVLMKAIEEGALGMAAAYRALDVGLPTTLPPVTREVRRAFLEVLAEFQPFDLVIDERTVDGHDARVSKTSVAQSWGGVSGSIRYFADRQGVARASIEGTTIPHDVIRRHAEWGHATLTLDGGRNGQGLAVSRRLRYFGFTLESGTERLDGEIPDALQPDAVMLLSRALLAGEVAHPSHGRVHRAAEQLREYWRRSGGALDAASEEALQLLVRAQLADVTSWAGFQNTPVVLDVNALVPEVARDHLDRLPASIRLHGDAAPLLYEVRNGKPMVRVVLRQGQARRLRADDLPVLDRPLTFAVQRGERLLQAESLDGLRELLQREPAGGPKAWKGRPGKGTDPQRGGKGGRRGPPGRRDGGRGRRR